MLIALKDAARRSDIGSKARQIHWLMRRGYRVPRSYILPYGAWRAYRQDREAFLDEVMEDLEAHLDLNRPYAVRSSASLEDQGEFSFAGQFTTHLGVRGGQALREAIAGVLDSAGGSPAQAYLEEAGESVDSLEMAVLIQDMIQPEVSGVAFSRNPLTGLNEVVVEAAPGTGEAILQGGGTPERWVHKWGSWVSRPEHSGLRESILREVVAGTRRIAASFGRPVDVEWVHNGEQLYWVQVRPITGLGDLQIYSNRISREVLPGIIKPLVWSINTPMVNRAWIELFTELIGPNDLQPEDLARAFYYRAYFNMGTVGRIFEHLGLPADTLELLMGIQGGEERPRFRPSPKVLMSLPRMLRLALDKLRFSRRVEAELPALERGFRTIAVEALNHHTEEELVARVETLVEITGQAAYINIVVPLLMSVYTALFKRQLERLDVDFARFDLTSNLEGLDQYDPNPHLARLHRQFLALDGPTQERVRSAQFEDLADVPGLDSFATSLEGFLLQFGHLSESGNDFSVRPWAEDPDLVLQMVIHHHSADREKKSAGWEELPIRAWQRIPLRPLYLRARSYRLFREAISSLYTYGYGLFRRHFLALGDRFVERGILDQREDIFYLYFDEVRAVASDGSGGGLRALVSGRRQEIEASRDVILPEIIFGDQPPPIEAPGEIGERLYGIPTSRGYYRGPAKVIRSMEEFNKLAPGDVLVIPYSDVAWTPLFARAGAVVAEAGGILSHSSIVAREFAIPCVVSVEGACRIPDGSRLMIDGFKGEVHVSAPSSDM